MFLCRRMELPLTSHTTNINSQWVTDLNVALHYETVRRKHIKTLEDTFLDKYFWGSILKWQR